MLDAWEALPDGAVVDVEQAFTRMVTDAFALLFLGVDLGGGDADLREDWDRMLTGLSARMAMPFAFLQKIPTRYNRSFERSFGAVSARIAAIVEARRRGERAGDLLDAWIEAACREGDAGFDAKAVQDQILLLLLAGRKNVANAMTWGAYLLGRHSACARKLEAEASAVLAGREPEADDLAAMPSVAATQREILRLYPTAWLIARMALGDDVVGGYRVPAGATVFMSPYTIHRHPSFWNDPESFEPARFQAADPGLEPGTQETSHAYVPFGVGPRACVGKALSELMMQTLLVMVAQRFALSPKPGHVARIKATSSLFPASGMPMVLARRPRAVRMSP
jgi:cytochrome P450